MAFRDSVVSNNRVCVLAEKLQHMRELNGGKHDRNKSPSTFVT